MLTSPLFKNCKITRVINATAAGITNVTSSAIDMTGWDGVIFIACFGALTATQVTKLKLQTATTSGGSYADVSGSETAAMADADSNKMLFSDLYRPQQEFVKCVVERGTANAAIDSVIAIQYNGARLPVQSQDSSLSQSASVAN